MRRALDGFFISIKLKYACEQVYRNKVAGKEYNPELLKASRNLSLKSPYKKDPLIQIYRLIFELERHPDKMKKYYELKQLIHNNYYNDEAKEQLFYYGFLMNYISGQLKKGHITFKTELTDLLNFGQKSGIILKDKFLNPIIFTNFVHAAWQVVDTQFAKELVNQYQGYLNPNEKEEVLKIAWAEINYSEGKYQKVLDDLKNMTFSPGILNLQGRLILLKTYFETGEDMEYIEAARKSISRTDVLSEGNKKSLRNTLLYMKKLSDPNINKEALKESIKEEAFLFNRSWLLEKVEGLK